MFWGTDMNSSDFDTSFLKMVPTAIFPQRSLQGRKSGGRLGGCSTGET